MTGEAFTVEPEGAIILCMRPEHLLGFPVAGATIGKCDDCHHRIWVAPSSWDVRALHEAMNNVVIFKCCCCSGFHSRKDWAVTTEKFGELHTHHWKHGTCECGMSQEQFRKETGGMFG